MQHLTTSHYNVATLHTEVSKMKTSEQLENMITNDIEIGNIVTCEEEITVWNVIFSSLYEEELNQAANDDRLVEVYSYIRNGVLESIRNERIESTKSTRRKIYSNCNTIKKILGSLS